jgi:hypothetical protein
MVSGLGIKRNPTAADNRHVGYSVPYCHIVLRGGVAKNVTCEKCGQGYTYRLDRTVKLDVMPPLPVLVRRGERICHERLARRLFHDVEPVPCPSCGWMQSNTVPELRRRFLRPLKTFGTFIAVSGAALVLLSLGVGIYFRVRPSDADVNYIGIAAACMGVVALGVLLILLQKLFGRLRYRHPGFASRAKSKHPLLLAA